MRHAFMLGGGSGSIRGRASIPSSIVSARFLNDEVIGPQEALLIAILDRGIAAGQLRAVDVQSTAHQIMAPLVLKAIWRRSIEPCCSGAVSLDPERFIVHHLELMLRGLAPEPDA